MQALAKSTFLALALTLGGETAFACICQGCGCKGGPGWRDKQEHCVSHRELRKTCGEPPSTFCRYEGAVQVCPSDGRQRGRSSRNPKPSVS